MPPPTQRSEIGCDLTIEELLFGIVSALVDDGNEVRVTSKTELAGKIFQVTVAASEAGKIIGKNGRTATSIRGLLSAMGCRRKDAIWVRNNNKALNPGTPLFRKVGGHIDEVKVETLHGAKHRCLVNVHFGKRN